MAAFVHWLLAQGRTSGFAERVQDLRWGYHHDINGLANDGRIAGNFGVLAAAFEEVAGFLSDEWPEWLTEVTRYQEEDLGALRDQMLNAVREEQPGEVFWSVLGGLVANEAVALDSRHDKGKRVVGKTMSPFGNGLYWFSTDLALAAVAPDALSGDAEVFKRVNAAFQQAEKSFGGRL